MLTGWLASKETELSRAATGGSFDIVANTVFPAGGSLAPEALRGENGRFEAEHGNALTSRPRLAAVSEPLGAPGPPAGSTPPIVRGANSAHSSKTHPHRSRAHGSSFRRRRRTRAHVGVSLRRREVIGGLLDHAVRRRPTIVGPFAIECDPSNRTLSRYERLRSQRLELLDREQQIDRRRFDVLVGTTVLEVAVLQSRN